MLAEAEAEAAEILVLNGFDLSVFCFMSRFRFFILSFSRLFASSHSLAFLESGLSVRSFSDLGLLFPLVLLVPFPSTLVLVSFLGVLTNIVWGMSALAVGSSSSELCGSASTAGSSFFSSLHTTDGSSGGMFIASLEGGAT